MDQKRDPDSGSDSPEKMSGMRKRVKDCILEDGRTIAGTKSDDLLIKR